MSIVHQAITAIKQLIELHGVDENDLVECVLLSKLLTKNGVECRPVVGYLLFGDIEATRHVSLHIPTLPHPIIVASYVPTDGRFENTLPKGRKIVHNNEVEALLDEVCVRQSNGLRLVDDYDTVLKYALRKDSRWLSVVNELA